MFLFVLKKFMRIFSSEYESKNVRFYTSALCTAYNHCIRQFLKYPVLYRNETIAFNYKLLHVHSWPR